MPTPLQVARVLVVLAAALKDGQEHGEAKEVYDRLPEKRRNGSLCTGRDGMAIPGLCKTASDGID